MENNPIIDHYQKYERKTEIRLVISENIVTIKDSFKTVDNPEEKVIDLKWFRICWTKHHYTQIPVQHGHIILTIDEPVRPGTIWIDENGNNFIARKYGCELINAMNEIYSYKNPYQLLFIGSTYIGEGSTR